MVYPRFQLRETKREVEEALIEINYLHDDAAEPIEDGRDFAYRAARTGERLIEAGRNLLEIANKTQGLREI